MTAERHRDRRVFETALPAIKRLRGIHRVVTSIKPTSGKVPTGQRALLSSG
jgi:hypothetical protein